MQELLDEEKELARRHAALKKQLEEINASEASRRSIDSLLDRADNSSADEADGDDAQGAAGSVCPKRGTVHGAARCCNFMFLICKICLP